MAQLTLPIVMDELLIDVRLNLHAPALAALQAAQRPAPRSLQTKAILDTGSNATGAYAAFIQLLSLAQSASSRTHGIGGLIPVQLYQASFIIVDPAQPHVPLFVQPDFEVMELPPATPIDDLIGIYILLEFRLLTDGLNRLFTLDH